MHVRDSRERVHRSLLLMAEGAQRVAEARRSAIAHCLAHALAVRVLRRHQREQIRMGAEALRQS